MFINGNPYTNFLGVNAKNKRVRLQSGAYGVALTAPETLTAERTIETADKSGTIVLKGASAHQVWGTVRVDLPIIAAVGNFSTIVTLTTFPAKSFFIGTFQDTGTAVLIGATIGATATGTVTLDLWNPSSIASAAQNRILNYIVLNPY